MSPIFDLSAEDSLQEGLDAAVQAIGEGKLVVLPTDTVYGIGADAFNATAVAALLKAKGRGREMPPPVLIPNARTIEGLAMNVPSYARRLAEKFWPGALTLIFRAQPSLMWDLGDTNGTVALRMPNHKMALELLERTGPMAVSSANQTGKPVVKTINEAGFAFGPAVEVYFDAGELPASEPSTILDCTKADPVVLRAGAISVDELRDFLGPIDLIDGTKREDPHVQEPNAGTEAAASVATADAASEVEPAAPEQKSSAPSGSSVASTDQEAPTRSLADFDAGSDAVGHASDSELGVTAPPRKFRQRRSELASATEEDPTTVLPAGEHPTSVLPTGGVGAEPPFEREVIPPVELPTKSTPSND